MFQFELHPHTGEIRTEILVYEKGGVIKHVKAPAINKVELPHLIHKMWMKIQFFLPFPKREQTG